MERKQQVSHVAFGGDWSEAIVPVEETQAAVQCLRRAVEECGETDPRTPEVRAALDLVCRMTRGDMLSAAFWRAGGIANPDLRRADMQRCLRLIESSIGKAAGQ